MRLSAFALVTVAVLASCTGGGSPTPSPTPLPTVEAVAPRTAPPRLEFTTGVLLQHLGRFDGVTPLGGEAGDSVLVPLEASTGEPIPARDPLLLHDYATARSVSPDGRTLAIVVRGEGGVPQLQLVKLDPTTAQTPELADPIAWPAENDPGSLFDLGTLSWAPDSASLYWLRSRAYVARELWTLNVDTAKARRLAALEGTGWGPPLVSPDGRTIYALRRPCCDHATEGDAYVIAIDASSGAEIGRASLPRFVLRSPETRLVVPPQARFQLEPAAALSPDGSRIYVVHADADLVTTVTTETLATDDPVLIGPRSPESPIPLIGRTTWVRVSPDGRWLYVTGVEDVACRDDLSRTCEAGNPLGLQIISTQSLEPVRHQPGIERLLVTPNDRWLVGTGSVKRWDNAAQAMVTEGFGLTILEADSGRSVAILEPGATIEEFAISPDSRYLYYRTLTDEPNCSTCSLLTVYDLELGEIVAERSLGPRPISLVSLAPAP